MKTPAMESMMPYGSSYRRGGAGPEYVGQRYGGRGYSGFRSRGPDYYGGGRYGPSYSPDLEFGYEPGRGYGADYVRDRDGRVRRGGYEADYGPRARRPGYGGDYGGRAEREVRPRRSYRYDRDYAAMPGWPFGFTGTYGVEYRGRPRRYGRDY